MVAILALFKQPEPEKDKDAEGWETESENENELDTDKFEAALADLRRLTGKEPRNKSEAMMLYR